MDNTNISHNLTLIWDKIYGWIPEAVSAILIFLIGFWLIRKFTNKIKKTEFYKNFDPSVAYFVTTAIKIGLYIILFISIASMLGIPMTSFIAILGSVGIAIGLAMQSHLSNIAAGIEILILKPIKIGDFVQIQNFLGTVKKIRLFFTILNTVDNKQVLIPNNIIMSNSLLNFSAEDLRKLDVTVGISYESSILKAKEIIQKILDEDKRVLNEPEAPLIVVSNLAESSVHILVRCWVKTDYVMDLQFSFLEKVKMEFDKEGIGIPYPQRDVHIYNGNTN